MLMARNPQRVSDLGSLREALAELATPREPSRAVQATKHAIGPEPYRIPERDGWRDPLAPIKDAPHPVGVAATWRPWVMECPRCGFDLYGPIHAWANGQRRRVSRKGPWVTECPACAHDLVAGTARTEDEDVFADWVVTWSPCGRRGSGRDHACDHLWRQ